MFAASPTLIKQKNPVLLYSRERELFGKRFLYHLLLNVIRHSSAKFAPLDFIDKTTIGKRDKTNIPFRELPLITFGVGPEGKLLGHETKISILDGL